MHESWKSFWMRLLFNVFPAYRGTGGRITLISHDLREMRVKIPLNWRTRNYVGTIFGGSLYGAVDPMYMLMLIKILGPDYVVWDKSASIQFVKPGQTTLYATFHVSEQETEEIKKALESERSVDRVYQIELVDKEGEVHAVVEKKIFIKRKAS